MEDLENTLRSVLTGDITKNLREIEYSLRLALHALDSSKDGRYNELEKILKMVRFNWIL